MLCIFFQFLPDPSDMLHDNTAVPLPVIAADRFIYAFFAEDLLLVHGQKFYEIKFHPGKRNNNTHSEVCR